MLRSTLIAEGTADRALLPILRWLLVTHWAEAFADPQFFGTSAISLARRVSLAVRDYPCELLLVHRDADRATYQQRVDEIREAITASGISPIPLVCVVPVRATEAWLLLDERAIRRAAGHPNGRMGLSLPRPDEIEVVSAPKERLHDALRQAAELTGRRLKKFHVVTAVSRVAESMEDFANLRRLSAFRAFEGELCKVLDDLRASPIGSGRR